MKKTKLLLRTDFRSDPGKLIKISRFFILLALIGAISLFQGKVNAQDIPGDNTGPLAAVTNARTINNNDAELQQTRITGTVLNERGEPLAGATVMLDGTTIVKLTDAK